MKSQTMILIYIIVAQACATTGAYRGYTNWDLNADNHLNVHEFSSGYIKSNYFLRWGDGNKLTEKEFYDGIFNALDVNKDTLVTFAEFQSKIDFYYFDMFNGNFYHWDDDSNKFISKKEFERHASTTNLFAMWDKSVDARISEKELATGLFYFCDINNDRTVNSLEFNIWNVNR